MAWVVYGAKGGGEGALNPVAAAIANVVYRASGVRLREAPFTPERVWRAIQEREQLGSGDGPRTGRRPAGTP